MGPLHADVEWIDIAWRLGGATVAGVLIGLNRGEHGKPAGLRTILLVCLAAALAMILGNILIGTRGKASDGFVNLDTMRLPLGILTGIGFIGAGAIIKKGDLVVGVTTAATIWFVTVVGLCFGAGQIELGWIALALGMAILSGLSLVENRLRQERRGQLIVKMQGDGMKSMEQDVRQIIRSSGCDVVSWGIAYGENYRALRCDVRWRARRHDTQAPEFLKQISEKPGVTRLVWRVS